MSADGWKAGMLEDWVRAESEVLAVEHSRAAVEQAPGRGVGQSIETGRAAASGNRRAFQQRAERRCRTALCRRFPCAPPIDIQHRSRITQALQRHSRACAALAFAGRNPRSFQPQRFAEYFFAQFFVEDRSVQFESTMAGPFFLS